MSGSNHNDDEELLIPHGEDQTSSEPWQPITTPYHDASGYDRSSYPVSSDGGRKPNQADEYRDEYTDEAGEYRDVEQPPGYYNQPGQKRGASDDDELLVPPRDDQRRPRWDMAGNPYQTQRFYDDPRQHNVPQGYPQYQQYPQYPQQSSANASSNSNNIVLVQPGSSQSCIVIAEHVSDYTALSIFTLLCCCLPLGICALIKARDSQTSLQLGRREEALEHSRTARNLNIAGIIIGPVLATIIILLRIFVLHQ